MSNIQSTRVSTALNARLKKNNFFRENLSARAPAKGATTVIGNAKVRVTKVSANGESPVTLSINQLRVIICIFIAIKETNEPIHIHLKSLYESESRIVDKRNVDVVDFAEV